MPVTKRLDEAIIEILEKVESGIRNEIKVDGYLEGIKEVFVGDRIRDYPKLPLVWIICDPATPTHTHRALAETWTLPVMLICFVESLKPEEGYKEANKLAALTRTVVLKDKILKGLNYVQDTQSGMFNLAQRDPENAVIFGAAAVINIIFTILEI